MLLTCRSILPQLIADDVLRENRRSVQQQLASLRLVTSSGLQPTPTGLLLIGHEPEDHLPGSYVQFLRFDGTQLSDPTLSEHRISGTIQDMVLDVEEILRTNIDTVVQFEGLVREQRKSSVPFEALQQLLRNALLHSPLMRA
jgi:ATP-dependent DNA helicase RecG